MEKLELVKGLKYLGIAYGKEFDEEECQVYYDFLKNYSMNIFSTAIKNLIPKSKFIPKLNEIMSEIVILDTPQLKLDRYEEWDKVIDAIHKYGTYNEQKALDSLQEPTRTIVRQIGFYRLCTSENIMWERKKFEEMFDEKQDNYEERLVTNTRSIAHEEQRRIQMEDMEEREEDYE